MINKFYSKYVVNGHTYSRQPLASGQKYLDQMTAKSGHHVNESEVRGEKIPQILSIEERDSKFLTLNAYNERIVGNVLGSLYSKVIKFVDKASLQEIPNTNGESFQVIDELGNPLSHFIDPSDAPISNTKMSDGYIIQLFGNDKITPIPINYGWTFNTLNGIIHFAPEFKPNSENWVNKGFGMPVLEGFIYIGKYTTDNLDKVTSDIERMQDTIDQIIENSLAIQPFKFSTEQMEKIDGPYPREFTATLGNKYEYYQRLSFIVPGYCFEVTALDRDETIITELRHLRSGDTQIFMDLPWNVEYDKPILYWEFESEGRQGRRYPVIGKYSFVATTFIKNNGQKIEVKELINYDVDDFHQIISGPYTYMTDYEDGWRVPTPDSILENGPGISQSDSSVNVNINL